MEPKTPTITLYRDCDAPGSYGWSPFVAKLETRLRFSHFPYTVQLGSLSESPMGKLPYIKASEENGSSPSILSDSTLITKTLIEERVIDDLNAGLSPAQRAMDLAIRSLLEDKIYFMTTRERWLEDFYVMRDQGPLHTIPYPIRILVGYIVHSKITRTMHGQGTGRYSAEELAVLREEAWTSLDELVAGSASRWILGGEEPSEADATLFGFLAATMTSLANPTAKKLIQGLPHLVKYANRVHDEYFPDYRKWT